MAARKFRSPDRGVWSRGVYVVGDVVSRLVSSVTKYYMCQVARTRANNTAPDSDTTGWVEIPAPIAGRGISTLRDVLTLSWVDLRNTIEAWDKEWLQGYEAFSGASGGSAFAVEVIRTKALMLGYMVWIARHQNGDDRSVELDISPQLVDFSYNIDQLLVRTSHVPLTPANA